MECGGGKGIESDQSHLIGSLYLQKIIIIHKWCSMFIVFNNEINEAK